MYIYVPNKNLHFLALGAKPTSHFVGSSFLETRLSSKSLETLIGFLAYLEPKLWLKTKIWKKLKSYKR